MFQNRILDYRHWIVSTLVVPLCDLNLTKAKAFKEFVGYHANNELQPSLELPDCIFHHCSEIVRFQY